MKPSGTEAAESRAERVRDEGSAEAGVRRQEERAPFSVTKTKRELSGRGEETKTGRRRVRELKEERTGFSGAS